MYTFHACHVHTVYLKSICSVALVFFFISRRRMRIDCGKNVANVPFSISANHVLDMVFPTPQPWLRLCRTPLTLLSIVMWQNVDRVTESTYIIVVVLTIQRTHNTTANTIDYDIWENVANGKLIRKNCMCCVQIEIAYDWRWFVVLIFRHTSDRCNILCKLCASILDLLARMKKGEHTTNKLICGTAVLIRLHSKLIWKIACWIDGRTFCWAHVGYRLCFFKGPEHNSLKL